MTAEQSYVIKEAAKGNPNAEEFLRCWFRRCHFVDDLHDWHRDDSLSAERAIGLHPDPRKRLADMEAEWLFCLAQNPFWLEHKATLVPLMLTAASAWEDSNRMPPGTVRDVLKAQWHEVVWATAMICGGWPHMRAVAARNRDFDIEMLTDQLKEVPDGIVRS
jgi:hypothetical protein